MTYYHRAAGGEAILKEIWPEIVPQPLLDFEVVCLEPAKVVNCSQVVWLSFVHISRLNTVITPQIADGIGPPQSIRFNALAKNTVITSQAINPREKPGCFGVCVNYRSAAGHTLIDRRLFLPEEWAADYPRREEAGVPEAVVFRTKPELAVEMVQQAVERGLPFRWVTADSVYGNSPTFVQGIRGLGKWYVVDTSADARVWLTEPVVIPAGTKGPRGRATNRPRVATKPERVDEVVARLPVHAWKRIVVAEGSQGPRIYEYACLWVWFSEEGLPSGCERLLVRRSLGQQVELKYHRSNAPAEVVLEKLAQVRGGHWSVEQSFEAAKGECGLDEYETRGWVGWHHHTALSLLALWFLGLQKRRLGEKRAPNDRARSKGVARASARQAAVG